MQRFVVRFFLVLILALVAGVSLADVKSTLPDFYAEPGAHPFRSPLQDSPNETIDPFSGALRLSHVDLVVPGNGGLDIRIQRTYNSNNVYLSRKSFRTFAPYLTELLPRTTTGLGWTLHFGRVLKSEDTSRPFNVCDTNSTSPNDDTLDNPVLELPDGSMHTLFVNATGFDRNAIFVTRSQWAAYCYNGGEGLLVISPDGVRYTMNYHKVGGHTYTTERDHAWYTTRIEDRNGNYLLIDYNNFVNLSGTNVMISRIRASDGRTVLFGYDDMFNPNRARLAYISANGQIWRYVYTHITGQGGNYYELARVVRPDGSSWRYDYYSRGSGQPGDKVLRSVTYPYGGTTTYDYGYECFNDPGNGCGPDNNMFYSLVVTSKVTGGRDVTPGTWTFRYAPSVQEDVTTVDFPGGRTIYKHYGSRMLFGGPTVGTALWRIGLLKEKLTYDGNRLVDDEIYTWDGSHVISNEAYVRPPFDGTTFTRYADPQVIAPVLVQRQIIRDGTAYTTTYSNFDANLNPQTITESGQANRVTTLTYYPRLPGQNIVHKVQDEQIDPGFGGPARNIYRTFDSHANLVRIVRHGVAESYSYYPTGDLQTKTNARGQVWTYQDYVRGTAQTVIEPEQVQIHQTVNPTGTVASETNGRGFTTQYSYDDLNRLVAIRRPLGAPTTISWTPTTRTVTRGAYTQTLTYDGFGRPSFLDSGGITVDTTYDALGRKSFVSYPSSNVGTTYRPDALGRIVRTTNGDGSSMSVDYGADNVDVVTNERGYTTTRHFRSFGDPDRGDERVLMQIDDPTGSTVFTRNVLGQILSVSKGGVTRLYQYATANNFLVGEDNPETGHTTFSRDEVGNMISWQVGASGVTHYSYDGLDRLTAIDYPNATPDVSITYDANNNRIAIDNGLSRHAYSYDGNDNLIGDTLTVGGNTYIASYRYTDLDYLDALTYPSGRMVRFAPDALGRPTQVAPLTTGIGYFPSGQPAFLQYANGVRTDFEYTSRQWLARIAVSNGVENLSYSYDARGNVAAITDGIDSTDNQSFDYDGIDRLVTANGPWGTGAIQYDAADNIVSKQIGQDVMTYNYVDNKLSTIGGVNSESFGYDAYGNVVGNSLYDFVYDDASNLREARARLLSIVGHPSPLTIAMYDYDANNRRVRQTKDGVETDFFYAANGDLLGEYEPVSHSSKEYAYFQGKLLATVLDVAGNPPGTPPSITVPPTSDNGFYVVSWTAASGTVTHYELQESTQSDFSTARLAYRGPDLSVNLSNPNGTYYYRVRACNGLLCGPFVPGANPIVINITPPGTPNVLNTPRGILRKEPYKVSWSVASGSVTYYELDEAQTRYFWVRPTPTSWTTIYVGPNTEMTLTKVSGYYYWYRVRACNPQGCSAYIQSDWPTFLVRFRY